MSAPKKKNTVKGAGAINITKTIKILLIIIITTTTTAMLILILVVSS